MFLGKIKKNEKFLYDVAYYYMVVWYALYGHP